MTCRDWQSEAKAKGRPWDVAKGVDGSLPLAPLVAMPGKILSQGEVRLAVNGQVRQVGDLAQMIWTIPELIAALSRVWRLAPGDLIPDRYPRWCRPRCYW